ncbi:MAG: amidohydrolase family protein [Asticcacaulis sp.]
MALFLLISAPAFAKEKAADTVFLHGYVYTVDAHDSVVQALAVKGGVIVYAGDDAGARVFTGRRTRIVDLAGRMLMPGLIDGHMHPQSGGLRMLDCNLNYESLTVAEFQAGIQKCVDADPAAGPDDWLKVINWFERA